MRGTTLLAALVLTSLPALVPGAAMAQIPAAQNGGQSMAGGGAPAGTSIAAPDLATYGRQLQALLDDLHKASGRQAVQTATEGKNDERAGRQDLLRRMQETLGAVRAAPTAYRETDDYKEAERRVRIITQRVQGQHEPSDLNGPSQEIIQAIETLHAKVVAAAGAPATR